LVRHRSTGQLVEFHTRMSLCMEKVLPNIEFDLVLGKCDNCV
jgi:hypothetical protein